eukprot:g75123.t1
MKNSTESTCPLGNGVPQKPHSLPTMKKLHSKQNPVDTKRALGSPTEGFVFFWGKSDWGSQWHKSPFTVDGLRYTCAEQWMMAEKARLFGDEKNRKAVLATNDPKKQKGLGRKVQGFDPAVWEKHREEIVYQGNLHKFHQNPKLHDALDGTGNKVLVEASPYDRIWGIGMLSSDPRAINMKQWEGLNLLGIALMRVRETLREEASAMKAAGTEPQSTDSSDSRVTSEGSLAAEQNTPQDQTKPSTKRSKTNKEGE